MDVWGFEFYLFIQNLECKSKFLRIAESEYFIAINFEEGIKDSVSIFSGRVLDGFNDVFHIKFFDTGEFKS